MQEIKIFEVCKAGYIIGLNKRCNEQTDRVKTHYSKQRGHIVSVLKVRRK